MGDLDATRRGQARSVAVYARSDGEELDPPCHGRGERGRARPRTTGCSTRSAAPARAGRDGTRHRPLLRPARRRGLPPVRPGVPGTPRAWQRGDRVLAEVELPESGRARPSRSGSIRRCWTRRCTPRSSRAAAGEERCRSASTGVALRASGASRLRVALTRTDPTRSASWSRRHHRRAGAVDRLAGRAGRGRCRQPRRRPGRGAALKVGWIADRPLRRRR